MKASAELARITVQLPHESPDAGRERLVSLAHSFSSGERIIAVTGRWHGLLGWTASEWEVWKTSRAAGAVQVTDTVFAFRRARAVSLAEQLADVADAA